MYTEGLQRGMQGSNFVDVSWKMWRTRLLVHSGERESCLGAMSVWEAVMPAAKQSPKTHLISS